MAAVRVRSPDVVSMPVDTARQGETLIVTSNGRVPCFRLNARVLGHVCTEAA